nr:immunoglobulin heavy chain junction region [Mus musculus]
CARIGYYDYDVPWFAYW